MLRQRQPRVENPAFLAFVRRKPCCVCGAPPRSHAAHIRMASLEHGKRETGAGEKASDQWTTPQCASCHLVDQHGGSERAFWAKVGIDPFALALELYRSFAGAAQETLPKPPRRRQQRASVQGAKVRMPKRKWPTRPFAPGRKFSNQRNAT